MQAIRFINDFILTTTDTYLDEESGKLKVKNTEWHIKRGDIYYVDSVDIHTNSVDIYFSNKSPIRGVAHSVEKEYCEFMQPSKRVSGGCGGCGKKG